MQTFKQYSGHLFLSMILMLTLFVAGCGNDDTTTPPPGSSTNPTVLSTTPIKDDTNVSINSKITASFDKELEASTVNADTFTLTDVNGSVAVDGNVTYANKAMIFKPNADLNKSTLYTATITTGVKDTYGNALAAEKTWSFTTGTTADDTAPTVLSTDPGDNNTSVSTNKNVTALFSEALEPSTVNTDTFTLKNGTSTVTGAVSYTNNTMTFDPASVLATNTTYTATITTGVTDLADNALAAEKTWSFTTATTVAKGPAPVELGTAGSFAILSKTAIATAGTDIIGDIGISPAALSFITQTTKTLVATGNVYETSPEIVGKIYASDMETPTPDNMTTAVGDMELAYADAKGRINPDFTNTPAGNIGGSTLAPGLYKWSTDLYINSDVTISGGATDVWIFQIAQNLIVADSVTVTLAGGALAKNIFWQVEGGAGVTIGTSADFKGIVLTQTKIDVNTNATVKGRLLAQTAVTLMTGAVTDSK